MVTDSRLAKSLSLEARFGRPCGEEFDAAAFLERHPQYAWQKAFLRNKPKQPWALFP